MTREVSIRIVPLDAGERTSLEENEKIARVEWNGRKGFRLIIIQDPVPRKSKLTEHQDIGPQADPRRGRERVARSS
jgi:hypothetical protein